MPNGDLIGTTEAARRCGVERSTFFRWYQLGQIKKAGKLEAATGALLFQVDEVDALAARKAAEKAEAAS